MGIVPPSSFGLEIWNIGRFMKPGFRVHILLGMFVWEAEPPRIMAFPEY